MKADSFQLCGNEHLYLINFPLSLKKKLLGIEDNFVFLTIIISKNLQKPCPKQLFPTSFDFFVRHVENLEN